MEKPITVQVPLQSKLLCNIVNIVIVVVVNGHGGDGDGEHDVDEEEEEDSLSRWMSAPASNW